jgi:nucleotide-binding universal stress UspA family protein
MSFKTILVHVAEDEAGRARAEAAVALAERFDARLVGLACAAQPAPIMAEGSVAMSGLWAGEAARYEEAAQQAAARFEERAQAAGLRAEARVAGGFEENAARAFALSARYADLAVIGGRDGVASRGLADGLLDAALFDSGRPVLAAPAAGAAAIGLRPMLAWDGGASAARAAREALPFLTAAESVHVCVARSHSGAGAQGEEPGADVARWLSGHGVRVEVETLEPDGSVSEALAEAARRRDRDLIVMGGFGHSRLRESLFGGVTADLVGRPPVPLLLAH